MKNYIAVYSVLNALPTWATAIILYMVTIGVIFILRDRCEGLFYNTSYSAMIGDGALVVIVLMAAGILQRGAQIPIWLQGEYRQFAFLMVGLVFGIVWFLKDQPGQWGDRYHHLVIAPLLCYLLITLLPVIFQNGNKVEVIATICFFAIWAVLALYDFMTGRLDQRNYHGLGEYLDAFKRNAFKIFSR